MDSTIVIDPKQQPHHHTIIWIHGLAEGPQRHVEHFGGEVFGRCRIVLPSADVRPVTIMKKEVVSWYDIKFRSEKSFLVDFDEAFSSAEVHDSFQKILKPLIEKERQVLKQGNPEGKLIVGGFSQGCGMALHCLFELPELVDYVFGVSGYLFPFSKFQPELVPRIRIIYGNNDNLRPWEFVKVTYDKKIPEKCITLLDDTKHEVNKKVEKELDAFVVEKFS